MRNRLSIEEYNELKNKYNIDDDLVVKLMMLASYIERHNQEYVSIDELIIYLDKNIDNKNDNEQISLNDKLKKYLELNTKDDIIILFNNKNKLNSKVLVR